MSSRLRAVCFAGLFVGCAALLGVGCSDDSTKKVHGGGSGEAGEAGEPGAGGTSSGTGGLGGTGGVTPTGGDAGAVSEAGQGGTAVVGAAGAPAAGAPTLSEAGAGGEAGSGTGLACEPSGNPSLVTFDTPQNTPIVCRGAIITTGFTASQGSGSFTCCGTSDTATPYSVILSGVIGDGGGDIGLQVPVDAPYGTQTISATCTSGDATNTFDIDVSDSNVLPQITTVTEPETASSYLSLDGSGLAGVNSVVAVSVENSADIYDCAIETQNDGNLTCYFSTNPGIPTGEYNLTVTTPDCGTAFPLPSLTITVPPNSL